LPDTVIGITQFANFGAGNALVTAIKEAANSR